jgi:hypothetical protein
MGRIAYTFDMMRSSWELLKQEKRLVVFPLISGFCCLLVMLAFGLPLVSAEGIPSAEKFHQHPALYYGVLFAFYFVSYFVIIFFNSALISCAIGRMRGAEPTISSGFNMALSRLPQIAGWALVSATVGIILRIIEDRSKAVGRFVAGLLGMGWSIATFFVVPILVVERKGPFAAVRESAALFRKTWGERFIGAVSFGLVFFILVLPGIIAFLVGGLMHAASPVLGGLLVAVGIIYIVALGLVQATLQTIFQAAVYLYARDGRAPRGFSDSGLSAAMVPAREREE